MSLEKRIFPNLNTLTTDIYQYCLFIVNKYLKYMGFTNVRQHKLFHFCNGFEITFVSEKHVVEDNVLFTNHLAGK